MAFPISPVVDDEHIEGDQTFKWSGSAWTILDKAGAGSTNLGYTAAASGGTVTSTTGTNADIPDVGATNAGLMTPAQSAKLEGIEAGAKGDQTAADVPVSPSGNLAATDVAAALTELQGDIDGLSSMTGSNTETGSGAPTGATGDDGDYYYDVATGDYYGPKTSGSWGTPVANDRTQRGLADATEVGTLTGSGGTAATVARSDHAHAFPSGSTLPAVDASEGVQCRLIGHASLPDGIYWTNGIHWVQA